MSYCPVLSCPVPPVPSCPVMLPQLRMRAARCPLMRAWGSSRAQEAGRRDRRCGAGHHASLHRSKHRVTLQLQSPLQRFCLLLMLTLIIVAVEQAVGAGLAVLLVQIEVSTTLFNVPTI